MDQISAQNKYRPHNPKIVFIAEAHPCTDGQFFYYESVPKQDNLFMYLIRSVFPDLQDWDTKKIRAEKPALLQRFMDEGYFMDFSVNGQIVKGTTPAKKEKLIVQSQEDLNTRIEQYKNSAFVLLTASVFKANYNYLNDKAYTVLNSSAIPYPGSGQQTKFKEAMFAIGFGK